VAILKERAVALTAHLGKDYEISPDGGYWTKVVFRANGAASWVGGKSV